MLPSRHSLVAFGLAAWLQAKRLDDISEEQQRTNEKATELRFENYVANLAAADQAMARFDKNFARSHNRHTSGAE